MYVCVCVYVCVWVAELTVASFTRQKRHRSFILVRTSVIANVPLSLFVPRLSFFGCLGKAVLPDCGLSFVISCRCLQFVERTGRTDAV